MKSLFFLSALFFVGSYGDTVSITTCTTSTGCSGSDCNTVSTPIDTSCQTVTGITGGSTKVSCENNLYSALTWLNDDCSGAPTTNITAPTDDCIGLFGGIGSVKYTCDSAPVIKVFAAIFIAIIAYFYQ